MSHTYMRRNERTEHVPTRQEVEDTVRFHYGGEMLTAAKQFYGETGAATPWDDIGDDLQQYWLAQAGEWLEEKYELEIGQLTKGE